MQAGRSGFKSWFCWFLAECPWTSTSFLRLSFSICKMRPEVVSTSQDGCGIRGASQI